MPNHGPDIRLLDAVTHMKHCEAGFAYDRNCRYCALKLNEAQVEKMSQGELRSSLRWVQRGAKKRPEASWIQRAAQGFVRWCRQMIGTQMATDNTEPEPIAVSLEFCMWLQRRIEEDYALENAQRIGELANH